MLLALLTLLISLQTQTPKMQEPVHTVSAPIAAPSATIPPTAPASATVEVAPEPEAEPEPEEEAPLPTRQVCRYVEVTGQRFPVRTCRTATIQPAESH